jgi:hypothetical protein
VGYGCWVWRGHDPDHFAAIAPVVGGIGRDGPKDVTDKLNQQAANLACVPGYAFAGAKDKAVPAERFEHMKGSLKTLAVKTGEIVAKAGGIRMNAIFERHMDSDTPQPEFLTLTPHGHNRTKTHYRRPALLRAQP